MVTLSKFKEFWESYANIYKDDTFYPFSTDKNKPHNKVVIALSDIPQKIDIIEDWVANYGPTTFYNAPISQDHDNHQYSYEKGYYDAFKVVSYFAYDDSESYLMPAMFLARHYTELCLKDSIFNISLVTGSSIQIGSKQDHDLSKLGSYFHKLLDTTDLDILKPMFFDIINKISSLSPKGDEFRFTTDLNGKYHFPVEPVRADMRDKLSNNNSSLTVVNLIQLAQGINYLYLYFEGLYKLLYENCSVSLLYNATLDPYISGLINGVAHSQFNKKLNKYVNGNCSKSTVATKIKTGISSIINGNGLTGLSPQDIKVNVCDNSYRVSLLIKGQDSSRVEKLFDIYNNDQTWFIKTPSLFSKN